MHASCDSSIWLPEPAGPRRPSANSKRLLWRWQRQWYFGRSQDELTMMPSMAVPLFNVLPRHVSFKPCDERWEALQHGFPQDIQIDIEICMHKLVSHRDDLVPRQVGHLRPGLGAQLICRLSYDFDGLDERPHKLAIVIKVLPASSANKVHRLPRGIQHVAQPQAITG